MKCKNCKWFVLLTEPADFGDGECHRYPPHSSHQQETTGTESELYLYITVHSSHDWCGEFVDKQSMPLETRIYELHLSTRVMNCLADEGINTLGQLAKCDDRYLLCLRNFGRTSLHEVHAVLKKAGMKI